jgi:hypothetical protein
MRRCRQGPMNGLSQGRRRAMMKAWDTIIRRRHNEGSLICTQDKPQVVRRVMMKAWKQVYKAWGTRTRRSEGSLLHTQDRWQVNGHSNQLAMDLHKIGGNMSHSLLHYEVMEKRVSKHLIVLLLHWILPDLWPRHQYCLSIRISQCQAPARNEALCRTNSGEVSLVVSGAYASIRWWKWRRLWAKVQVRNLQRPLWGLKGFQNRKWQEVS